MNNMIPMALAFFTGILAGTFCFLGLWFTLQKMNTSKIPALWVLGSFILRTGVTLLAFYYVSMGRWENLLICLGGFIIARFAVMHFTKDIQLNKNVLRKEVNHEY